jgi:RNA exonuclease 4
MSSSLGPLYAIDVECVATAVDHNSRAVAQVSVVNQSEQPLLNLYIKPEAPVVSYLTPLTGLTAPMLNDHGIPLAQAAQMVRAALPKNAVLVGTNVRQDVMWLGLVEGEDFASMIDLSGVFRVWNPQYKSWSMFGQDHMAKVLMGIDTAQEPHNAVTDAIKSMQLYNLHQRLQLDAAALASAHAALLAAPVAPSFARLNPSFEGCCMGNRKTCTCGGTFFF